MHPVLSRTLRLPLRVPRKILLNLTASTCGTITHVRTNDAVVALTFDDGPDPEYTPRLLTVLKDYGARATFFMVGEAASMHPELVRRVAEAGHAIGNHSWDHGSFPLISRRERLGQIRRCADALHPYGLKLFRPPYGDQNIVCRLEALLLGYDVVMFNIATDDWCGGAAASVAEQLERRIRPGSIVVLHDRLADAIEDCYFDRTQMIEAVQILLQRTADRFRFLTVPELLRHGPPVRELWRKHGKVEMLNRLHRRQGAARRYVECSSRWRAAMDGIFSDLPPR